MRVRTLVVQYIPKSNREYEDLWREKIASLDMKPLTLQNPTCKAGKLIWFSEILYRRIWYYAVQNLVHSKGLY